MTIRFDDIVSAADANYAHTPVEFGDGDRVLLRNVLQMSEAERDEFIAIQDELGDKDANQIDVLQKAIRVVAEDKEAVDRLLEQVGRNLARLFTLFKQYTEGTQAGEA